MKKLNDNREFDSKGAQRVVVPHIQGGEFYMDDLLCRIERRFDGRYYGFNTTQSCASQ